MSSRTTRLVETTMDSIRIIALKGHITGTAGANPQDSGGPSNMTGTFDDGTEQRAVVTYFSGALGSKGYGAQLFPTASVLVELPPNNRYSKVFHWEVSMEGSGTDHKANSLSTIQQYEIARYGHNMASGSFVFGFQRISGSTVQGVDAFGNSGSYVGAIPEDRVNPSSMACEWSLYAVVRNTNRAT